jgi:hypothetical protein
LVEAASLAFLFTFAAVNWIAARQTAAWRWVSWAGAILAALAAFALMTRLALEEPIVLGVLAVMVLFSTVGRSLILRRLRG